MGAGGREVAVQVAVVVGEDHGGGGAGLGQCRGARLLGAGGLPVLPAERRGGDQSRRDEQREHHAERSGPARRGLGVLGRLRGGFGWCVGRLAPAEQP